MDIGHFLLTVVIHMTSCFFCLFFFNGPVVLLLNYIW